MPDPRKSPAVQSMLKEQAQQRDAAEKSTLDRGLEDTFPASDPVAATNTAVPAGRADADEVERVHRDSSHESCHLADDALAVEDTHNQGRDYEEGRTLRREAVRNFDAVIEIPGAVAVPNAGVSSFCSEMEVRIREKPLTVMGIVAALAYAWGATR
ncbi:hypothetical protein [Rhizobium sp. BK251]|uniref:hypothetical protein n=1 Tax=Rhizobium sp. BK251 TaxID=2512125 RepID=UPI0010505B56|nr:hypothetical protein [Rhizobium sp. BK251]TCL66317.1 hypothetical protein EV286_11128 [Rhizobium sp. BK251]